MSNPLPEFEYQTIRDESRGSSAEVTRNSVAALKLFFGIPKTLLVVGKDNDTFKSQLEKFWERFLGITSEGGALSIKLIEGRFFVNEALCKITRRTPALDEGIARWQELGIGGVEIRYAPESDSLAKFFEALTDTTGAKSLSAETSIEQLRALLADNDVRGLRVFSAEEVEHDSSPNEQRRLQMRRQARTVFFRSLRVLNETTSNSFAGRETQLKETSNVVRSMVDQVIEDDSALIEMTAIKDFDDYTFAHSVNVCIYSLSIGVRLHFDRKRLSQLGFAALFHDIGKVKLPAEVVKKPGIFNDNDWAHMRSHPIVGAKSLLTTFAIDSQMIRAALVAFEHHINLDNTGYPRRSENRDLNLFTRIITIADTFDALTSGRVYITDPVPPVEVMRKMMYRMRNKFDHLILKIFINNVGLFPAGSLVLLSNSQVAVVEKNNPKTPASPVVRTIGDRHGLKSSVTMVDLSKPEYSEITITRFLDPRDVNIDLKRFIYQDIPLAN
jgi:HD-GYP domain-containing protein (c-di-GMP phosphodiesterase class II)